MKNFFAAAVIATATLCTVDAVSTLGAHARPSDCWANRGGNAALSHFPCDVTRMEDRNGTWWNIDHGNMQFRLYNDGTAQLFTYGRDTTNGNNWYTWNYDSQGDFRIHGTGGYQFSFRK